MSDLCAAEKLCVICMTTRWHERRHKANKQRGEEEEEDREQDLFSVILPLRIPALMLLPLWFLPILEELTWLWIHRGSLPWIFLELNAFYREDGCSWNSTETEWDTTEGCSDIGLSCVVRLLTKLLFLKKRPMCCPCVVKDIKSWINFSNGQRQDEDKLKRKCTL